MKLDTHKNLGFGHVDLPELEMHTTACWVTLPQTVADGFSKDALQGGMLGIANLLRQLAPLYLMCAPRDIAVVYRVRDPFTSLPTLYLYDTCPGGVGLSEKLYGLTDTLLRHSQDALRACPCEKGCPSCVGPMAEVGMDGKATALAILKGWLT